MDEIKPTDAIAVIGAGTMGAGIAQVAATAGHPVYLYDAFDGAAERGLERTAKGLQRLVERGKFERHEVDQLLTRIKPVTHFDEMSNAALVIEAIVEDLEAKRKLFSQLETLCDDQTIFASNTSSISITAIAATLEHPERVVGMHFFNPAPVMKLVEVISGIATAPAVADSVHATCAAWGKTAVMAKSTPGFIVNRIARPYYGESYRLLQEGSADPITIDTALKQCGGFRMGPFELMDLIGVDVNFAVSQSVYHATFEDPRYKPSLIQREMVDAGYHGRKSGRGFFDYAEDAVQPEIRSSDPAAKPDSLVIQGDLGPAESLLDQIEQAGIAITRGTDTDSPSEVATLALTDGRTATVRAAQTNTNNLILLDLALDYGTAPRIILAGAEQATQHARAQVAGLFQTLGKEVTFIGDTAGMIVMRTVAMLANEAADAVLHQICSVADADRGMQLGVNYPLGPLQWADAIGLPRVLSVLDHLTEHYREDRYRASALLRQYVAATKNFY